MMGSGTRVAGLALFVSIGGLAVATASPARADDGAPGVARVHVLDGDVEIKRADATDAVAAVVNAPMNVGDYVSTQDGARTEIELGDRTALRVAPGSQLRFTRLDPNATALQLAAGTVDARLFDGVGAHPEIDVPGATITPQRSGSYRVTVDGDGNARVTVRSGAALVATNDDSTRVGSGTTLVVDGGRFEHVDALASDDFDAWNAQRDDDERDVPSYSYLDDRYVGADDLDRYGSWQDVSGYGNVWHPSYASDWAPYTDGRFAWEPYYGWTWVSAEPWGWAPYHYGRWFDAPGVGWCWSPGRAQAVAYQPALVTFFSFGGVGVDVGFGNIGWVPLAPNEAFHPWWGRGYGNGDGYRGGYGDRTVVNNITNITNVTNITNYRNYNAPGGIVALRRENFVAGRFDRRMVVTRETLRDEHPTTIRGVVPAVPTTNNLAFGGRALEHPHALAPTFAHFATPAARVASFDAQRDGVRSVAIKQYPERAEAFAATAAPGRPRGVDRVGGPASGASRVERPAAPAGLAPVRNATPRAPGSVWDRFGNASGAPRSTSSRPTLVEPRENALAPRAAGPRETTVAPRGSTVAPRESTVAPRESTVAPRTRTTDPWSRFSSGNTQVDTVRTGRPADRAPAVKSESTPARGNAASEAAPRTYAAPPRNDDPSRATDRAQRSRESAPATYDAPQRSREPAPAYDAPRRSHEASPATSVAPQRPHRSFAAPATHEAPPPAPRPNGAAATAPHGETRSTERTASDEAHGRPHRP